MWCTSTKFINALIFHLGSLHQQCWSGSVYKSFLKDALPRQYCRTYIFPYENTIMNMIQYMCTYLNFPLCVLVALTTQRSYEQPRCTWSLKNPKINQRHQKLRITGTKNMKEIFLSLFSFIASLFFVILFIGIGWYVVWKLFLSRFKFVRELLGENSPESKETKPRRPRNKLRHDWIYWLIVYNIRLKFFLLWRKPDQDAPQNKHWHNWNYWLILYKFLRSCVMIPCTSMGGQNTVFLEFKSWSSNIFTNDGEKISGKNNLIFSWSDNFGHSLVSFYNSYKWRYCI